MTCVICEIGELKPGITTFTMKREKTVIVFDGVPSHICDNCGEEFFDEYVNGRLLELAEDTVKTEIKLGIAEFKNGPMKGYAETALAC